MCRRGFWRLTLVLAVFFSLPPSTLAATEDDAAQLTENNIAQSTSVLWDPPGPVEELDLRHGPGGREAVPQPPFQFVREDSSGSTAKVDVTDAGGRSWNVKWGGEAKPEVFAARLVWAAGFFAVPTHLVAEGQILGAQHLKRAAKYIGGHGEFSDGRFQLREEQVTLVGGDRSWAWNDNPFLGTRQLHGLKILTMLLSNSDSKDLRDRSRGSNTGIFLDSRHPGIARYSFFDWGSSMGRWGGVVGRSKWDCDGYSSQTRAFVKGFRKDGALDWGYSGQRTQDIVAGISADDVRWFLESVLARLSDTQLEDALAAAGASPDEVDCFKRALRDRIVQLQALVSDSP